MTPKEKALELYNNYFKAIPFADELQEEEKVVAKRCAIIAVNEITKDYEDRMMAGHIEFLTGKGQPVDFWSKVKEEIEKL